ELECAVLKYVPRGRSLTVVVRAEIVADLVRHGVCATGGHAVAILAVGIGSTEAGTAQPGDPAAGVVGGVRAQQCHEVGTARVPFGMDVQAVLQPIRGEVT